MKPEEQAQTSNPIQSVGTTLEPVRDQDKIMLVLAYLGIFALIPLLTVNDSDYVKWHAKNGLVLGVGGGILLSILTAVIGLGCVLMPALMIIDILAMVKALKGERWRIPGVAAIADKL